jgi:hypothetical protein
MADRGGGRGDRGDRGDRGRGRGPRRPRGRKDEDEKWVPCTKLGRLVQQVFSSIILGLRISHDQSHKLAILCS